MIAALQHGPRADPGFLADHTMRPDVGGRINLRGRRHNGRRMDAVGENRFRKEQREHFGKGNPRVRDPDQYLALRTEFSIHDDRRRRAFFGPLEIFGVLGKCQVPRLGPVRRGKVVDNNGAVTHDLAL